MTGLRASNIAVKGSWHPLIVTFVTYFSLLSLLDWRIKLQLYSKEFNQFMNVKLPVSSMVNALFLSG